MRCDQCGKPLVFPESFICPRCKAESFNISDNVQGYCGRCHVFVDDPEMSPGVAKAMAKFWAGLEARRQPVSTTRTTKR
jgi:RNA polymerase subunit RPABC4/transcription elongation factor Spt4